MENAAAHYGQIPGDRQVPFRVSESCMYGRKDFNLLFEFQIHLLGTASRILNKPSLTEPIITFLKSLESGLKTTYFFCLPFRQIQNTKYALTTA